MKVLIIAGQGEAPGKTALAMGLGRRWKAAGKSVSYSRPVLANQTSADGPDGDSEFVSGGLGISAATQTSDILLVELAGDVNADGGVALQRAQEQDPDALVLLIVGYRQEMLASHIPQLARLAGVVVNGVPSKSLLRVRGTLDGLPCLGILPESRALLGFSVEGLARHLKAEYLAAPEAAGHLIQRLMLGANITDTATTYFVPAEGLAVFCRSDRPDIQLAALNQEARCLVLMGPGQPQGSVIHRAEDLGVPVLRVAEEPLETIARLDGLVEGQRFRQEGKIAALEALLARHFDFEALDKALGVDEEIRK